MNEVENQENNNAYIKIDKKFAILKQIGEGGFGGIFLGLDENNKYCAVKLNNMEKTEEIEREIELMKWFDHPNVLSIDHYSIKNGLLENETGETVSKTVSYIVMPFATKGDLGTYLTGDSYFEEDIAVFFFHQILHGINHIHEKRYVHLDMKPDNILITKDWQLKIADFGLSQHLKGEDGNGNFNKRRCGTTSFWSPEISLNFEYNGVQADLYAIGIILFVMIFGCRPFRESKTSDPLFMKLLQQPLAFWMAHPVTRSRIKSRTVSEEVVDLLARMLVVNPEERLSKEGIRSHKWCIKYNKDIYEENDYEDFEFSPEVLNEDDDSDYTIKSENLPSESDIVSQGIDTEKSKESEEESLNPDKSLSDIDVDSSYSDEKESEDILQTCIIPRKEFLDKVKCALKSMKPIAK